VQTSNAKNRNPLLLLLGDGKTKMIRCSKRKNKGKVHISTSYSWLSFCVIVIICVQIINAGVSNSWNDFQDYWQLDFVL